MLRHRAHVAERWLRRRRLCYGCCLAFGLLSPFMPAWICTCGYTMVRAGGGTRVFLSPCQCCWSRPRSRLWSPDTQEVACLQWLWFVCNHAPKAVMPVPGGRAQASLMASPQDVCAWLTWHLLGDDEKAAAGRETAQPESAAPVMHERRNLSYFKLQLHPLSHAH